MIDIETRPEQLFVIPRDTDKVLALGGVACLPEGARITFDCTQSDFALLIASTANFASVFAAGAIEAGHPGIAHGLVEHDSAIFRQTLERIGRAAVGIGAIATADDARVAGERIREFHTHIHGINSLGERVLATDPELYAAGWLPIEWMIMQSAIRLGFSEERIKRLHLEALIAYQCQGVDDVYAPKTYSDFCRVMEEYCDYTEKTEAIDRFKEDGISRPPVIPERIWSVGIVKNVVNGISRASTVHALPGTLASKYEYHDVPLLHRAAAASFATMCTYLAKYGPKTLRVHPHIAEHRYPARTPFGRASLAASWMLTNRLLGTT